MQFYLQTKPFMISKTGKRNFVSKKGRKGRGRRFGPVAEAGPTHLLLRPKRYARMPPSR
jgi:hypothetical protein